MKKVISIFLIVCAAVTLIGCHKRTLKEKQFIDALNIMSDDVEYGADNMTDKTYGKNYMKVSKDLDKLLDITGIGDTLVTETDKYVSKNSLEYEYKAINKLENICLKLDTNKAKVWEKQEEEVEKVIDTYKEDISRRC